MPMIRVELLRGRDIEQKREFAAVVTREAARILKCAPAVVDVVFVDVPELAAYRAESVVAWNGKTRNPAVSTLLSALKELMPITEDAS